MDVNEGGRRVMVLSDLAWEWLLEGAKGAGLWYKGRPSRTAFVEWLAREVDAKEVSGGSSDQKLSE